MNKIVNYFKVVAINSTKLKTNNKPRWLKGDIFWCIVVVDDYDDEFEFSYLICKDNKNYKDFIQWFVKEEQIWYDFMPLAEWRDKRIDEILEDD